MMSDYKDSTKCLDENKDVKVTLNTQKTASPKSNGSEVYVAENEILPSIPSV